MIVCQDDGGSDNEQYQLKIVAAVTVQLCKTEQIINIPSKAQRFLVMCN